MELELRSGPLSAIRLGVGRMVLVPVSVRSPRQNKHGRLGNSGGHCASREAAYSAGNQADGSWQLSWLTPVRSADSVSVGWLGTSTDNAARCWLGGSNRSGG